MMLTGLWPNILTNSSTFSETSASGMFLTAIITGMERGWLERAEFEQTVRKFKFNTWTRLKGETLNTKVTLAWDGIASRVLPDGEITLIIGGTGIKSDEAGYEPSNTDYRKGSRYRRLFKSHMSGIRIVSNV